MERKTLKQLLELYNITDYNYCTVSNEAAGKNSEPSGDGKCGDNICDSVEKSSGGKCPQDCK